MKAVEPERFILSLSRVGELYRLGYNLEACIIQSVIIEQFCKYLLYLLYKKDKRRCSWRKMLKKEWSSCDKELSTYLSLYEEKRLGRKITSYYKDRKSIQHHVLGGLKDFSSKNFLSDGETIVSLGKEYIKSKFPGILEGGFYTETLDAAPE